MIFKTIEITHTVKIELIYILNQIIEPKKLVGERKVYFYFK